MKPKLGDFGTSKSLQTIVGSSTAVGSFFYMAPEIIDGTSDDPLSSDVYRYCLFCCIWAFSDNW